MTGMSGFIYLAGITVLNARFIYWVWSLWRKPNGAPMALFRYSINYIMLLFVILLTDHYFILIE
jgi:protoheme IX farnesyltransferase